MEQFLAEKCGKKLAGLPQDINGAGLTGSRIDMGKSHRVAVVVAFDDGAGNIELSLQQHDAASLGNSKALEIQEKYFIKKDAETSFTEVAAPGASADLGVGGNSGIAIFEVLSEHLDRDNDFSHISANIASPGANAKVVSVMYDAHLMRHKPAHDEDL